MTIADDLATVERELRNYHDSGCFVYLASGACDCGISPPIEALEAHKRVEAEVARLERQLEIAGEDHDITEMHNRQRAEAAEAEVARLRDGLRAYADHAHPHIREIARTLLAKDGAAPRLRFCVCDDTPCSCGAAFPVVTGPPTIADALATLRRGLMLDPQPRDAIPSVTEVEAALARVEAEIARLQEERLDAVVKGAGWIERAEAAEAAVARLREAQVTTEMVWEVIAMEKRAEAAEAEVVRLRDALRQLLALYEPRVMSEYERAEFVKARTLLAEDGAV